MADAKLVRHLKVLTDKAETGPVSALKSFSIGNPEEVDGEGEVVPILSWVDDNLGRYVVSNSASSEWGRASPPALIVALPNRSVKKGDAIFLLTCRGNDHQEPNPSGAGTLHFVHLGSPARLWSTLGARIFIYRLEAVQTRALLPKLDPSTPPPPR